MAKSDVKHDKAAEVEAKEKVDVSMEPTAKPEPEKTAGKANAKLHHRLLSWYKSHKKISIPVTVILVVLIIFVIPFSRYNVLGLVMKKNFTIQVIDSETKGPVSGATVSLGPVSGQTDANGKAVLKAKVGPHTFMISKKYYSDKQAVETVPILSEKNVPSVRLTATGRQVKINITNTISKKPVANATIEVADITAQTDASGNTMIVLPPGVSQQKGTLTADGYNDKDVTVNISDKEVAQNNFTLTSAGKIYFLSKRTGVINLMKSDLDGTNQTVVVAGTGKEDASDTILLASRDWKYLAFKSKRDDGLAKLYYIDTSVDKLNTLDEGDANFTMIGWSGDNFIYQVDRNGFSNWQPNRSALKSFNAVAGKLAVLNQTDASGTDQYNYAYETYGAAYLIDNTLAFSKTWQIYMYDANQISQKQAAIYSINVDGTNFKSLKGFAYDHNPYNAYVYISSELYEPREIYYSVSVNGSATAYLKYVNGSLTADSGIADAYNKFSYPTYLLSPSGKQTFWVEQRDGQSAMLVGDQDGNNAKVMAILPSQYQNYGWYSDDYLLVSKSNSELYIMLASGVKDESGLIKVTDYHKPAYNFYGYGGGYGGL